VPGLVNPVPGEQAFPRLHGPPGILLHRCAKVLLANRLHFVIRPAPVSGARFAIAHSR
jgi:hypothetical protein